MKVAVDPTYYWQPMSTCPLGTKVQLLNIGGVACYGTVSANSIIYWQGWAPLPKVRKTMQPENAQ